MSVPSEPVTARIEVEFVLGANPIEGMIRDSGGSESSFSGWLELLGTLERVGGRGGSAWADELARGSGESRPGWPIT